MSVLDFKVSPLWAQKDRFTRFKFSASTNVLDQSTTTNISLYKTKHSKLPLLFVSLEGQYDEKTLLTLKLTSPEDKPFPIVMGHCKLKEGGGFYRKSMTCKLGGPACNSWNYCIMIHDDGNTNIFGSVWSVKIQSKHAFDIQIVKSRDCIDPNLKLISSS